MKHPIHFLRYPTMEVRMPIVSQEQSPLQGDIPLVRFVRVIHSSFSRVLKQQMILKMGDCNFPSRIRFC